MLMSLVLQDAVSLCELLFLHFFCVWVRFLLFSFLCSFSILLFLFFLFYSFFSILSSFLSFLLFLPSVIPTSFSLSLPSFHHSFLPFLPLSFFSFFCLNIPSRRKNCEVAPTKNDYQRWHNKAFPSCK